LLACRAQPRFETPEVELEPSFVGAAAQPAQPVEEAWWRSAGDAVLNELVERALAGNLDLEQAGARIRAARAELGMVVGEGRPRGDFAATAQRREPSTAVAGGEFLPEDDAAFHGAGFELAWELDLFGRRAREREAAEAGLAALQEDAVAVELALETEVVRQYVELRALEAEADLAARRRGAAARHAELVWVLVEGGLAGGPALAEDRARLAGADARLAPLSGERRLRVHALALLLGSTPREVEGLFERAPKGVGVLPRPPVEIASGLPVELLARRPDLRAAERRVALAWARGREAEAALFPRLSLGAALGLESESLADLVSHPARAMSFGAELAGPLFRGGVLRWAVRARDAEEEEARVAYERAVLVALLEVEDGLTRFERGRVTLAAQAERRSEAAAFSELAAARFGAGLVSELEALEAEDDLMGAELELLRAEAELVQAALFLQRALAAP
jgi:multidrug efflux system outer membrane protein